MSKHFEGLAAQLAAAANKPNPRTTVRSQVQLHPETVAKAEEHAKEQKKTRRKKPVRRNPPAVTESMTIRIPQEIMETALRLADGDMRRIELLPDGSAIVYNHPRVPGVAVAPRAPR